MFRLAIRVVGHTFLLVLIFFIAIPDTYAQHYPFRHYTETDGLANSTIFDIVQDSTGILWIARRSGISTYDGNTFRNYSTSDGLESGSYLFLHLDEKHILRALPERGELFFSQRENGRWKTMTGPALSISPEDIMYTSFEAFYKDGKPWVVAGTNRFGVMIFRNGSWVNLSKSDGLPTNNITSVKYFSGLICIATPGGLYAFDGNRIVHPFPDSGLPSPGILTMARDGNNLWLLGKDWLGYIRNGKFTLVMKGFLIPENNTGKNAFIVAGANGKMVFGNPMVVFTCNAGDTIPEILTRNSGLISEGGNAALIDREGNTWIAGYRGITKITKGRFISYYEHEGLFSNEIASGIEVSPDHYIFGHNGALSFFDGKHFTHRTLLPVRLLGKINARVLEIKKDPQGNIWFAACSMGLAKLEQNGQITWYHEREGLTGDVFTVDPLPGRNWYVGTAEGLFQYNDGRFEKVFSDGKKGYTIRKIFRNQGDVLLIATISHGLIEIRGNKITGYTCPGIPLANSVFSFLTDSRGRNWVGTAAGLCTIKGTELVKANHDLPSICRPVYLILEDTQQRLWFGTDNGIFRWDGKDLSYFTILDGLSGLEINRGAGLVDQYSNIWFGTNNGLTVYRPAYDYDLKKVPPPKLEITFIQAGKDSLMLKAPVDLPYKSGNLVFHFQAISFIDEKRVAYRYMLEGIDTEWSPEISSDQNQCNYYNLNPGKYRFLVKARNVLGIWSEPVTSPVITILDPFWKTSWFILLVTVVIAGLSYLIIRFILVSRYHKHLEKLVEERTIELKQSEKLLRESNQAKDSFFSIIAHDLRSPFNVMLGMLDLLTTGYTEYSDNEKQMMLEKLKNASRQTIDLLENLLTWARGQRGLLPFSPENIDIPVILRENINLIESAAHQKDIVIRTSGPETLFAFADKNMINVVIRNLLSNAVKYSYPGGIIMVGFSTAPPGEILVSVRDFGAGMSQEIKDNLFNIENKMVTRGTNREIGTGLGLILCRDFLGKNGGKIWVETEERRGSTFFFTLPVAIGKDSRPA